MPFTLKGDWIKTLASARKTLASVETHTVRYWLIGLVIITGILSVIVLYKTPFEADKMPVRDSTAGRLADIYLPVLSTMTAFYFGPSVKRSLPDRLRRQAFVFAIIIATLYFLLPLVILLLPEESPDDINDLLGNYRFTNNVALIIVGFFFSGGEDEQ